MAVLISDKTIIILRKDEMEIKKKGTKEIKDKLMTNWILLLN